MTLKPKQVLAITTLYEHEGDWTSDKIAEHVGTTTRTLQRWRHEDEEFQAEFKKYLSRQFKGLRPKAIRTLGALLESGKPSVQLGAVKEILDRSGFAVEQIITLQDERENVSPLEGLNTDELRILANATKSTINK
ncbi:phBC6A51 family helix-turn-helix protein [Periweissella cryptocerci]|nr:phBC6A51 family helix-turn-helix protein [Periweissella cryptocerci]